MQNSSEETENASHDAQKSQSDILAARREARRRRILENSNKRLTKITGREHNEPPPVDLITPSVIYPDPEMERDVLGPEEMSAATQEQDVLELLREFRTQAGMSPSGMQSQQTPPEPPSRVTTFLRTKIQFMMMGVIVSLLYATGNEWLVGNSVFLPLFCWEAVEVFLLKTYESKLNYLGIIFVFLGVQQRYVELITKVLETLNKIFQDFACFLWFFIVTHLTWGYVVQQKDFNEILFPNGREEGARCPNV